MPNYTGIAQMAEGFDELSSQNELPCRRHSVVAKHFASRVGWHGVALGFPEHPRHCAESSPQSGEGTCVGSVFAQRNVLGSLGRGF